MGRWELTPPYLLSCRPGDFQHIAALLAVVGVNGIGLEERAVAGGEQAEVREELRVGSGRVGGWLQITG